MPTVLRVGGFRVAMYLPPREHQPPHVHVFKDRGEVVIQLASMDRPQTIRGVVRMRAVDVGAAFAIVEAHAEFLLTCWRKYHEERG